MLNSASAQLIATILAAFVQVGVKAWIFNNVPDICSPNQASQLTCPHNQVFYTASAVWFVIIFSFRYLTYVFIKGSSWSIATVWQWFGLSSSSLCHGRRCFFATALLLLAKTVPKFLDQIHLHTCHSQRCVIDSTGYRHQLFQLVCGRLRLPVSNPEEELCVVEQVQLYYQRST